MPAIAPPPPPLDTVPVDYTEPPPPLLDDEPDTLISKFLLTLDEPLIIVAVIVTVLVDDGLFTTPLFEITVGAFDVHVITEPKYPAVAVVHDKY